MQLTRFTDYALRVLMYLGNKPGQQVTVREIADQHQVSYNHLIKVVHKLSTLGYVHSAKGRKGGISLAMTPDAINIGQVIRNMEASFQLVDCAGDAASPCMLIKNCRLKGVLDGAVDKFLQELDAHNLDDLL
ncbi:MAG: Rrf2 family transcriptional regulator [Thioalkalispiraceae bacterium]